MRYRFRPQKITIDIPNSDTEPWVSVIVQRIDLEDGSDAVIATHDRFGHVHRRFTEIAAEIYKHGDNKPGRDPGDISGVGVSKAIENAAASWIADKYAAEIDDEGHVIGQGQG